MVAAAEDGSSLQAGEEDHQEVLPLNNSSGETGTQSNKIVNAEVNSLLSNSLLYN